MKLFETADPLAPARGKHSSGDTLLIRVDPEQDYVFITSFEGLRRYNHIGREEIDTKDDAFLIHQSQNTTSSSMSMHEPISVTYTRYASLSAHLYVICKGKPPLHNHKTTFQYLRDRIDRHRKFERYGYEEDRRTPVCLVWEYSI